jgi:hypothetical protein
LSIYRRMTTDLSQKCPKNFYCNLCDYSTCYFKDYNKHIVTKKHINNENNGLNNANILKKKTYTCENCDRLFNDRAGLWRHKKKDICYKDDDYYSTDKTDNSDKNDKLIEYLMKENKEIKELILEIVKNGTMNNCHNTTNNSNSHNKAFNLNFFLNETCKNAMNITDFVDSIKLQLSDFMDVGELGYVQGISNIIVKKLKDLDETVRPIHCTDQKRETFYVKDQDKWEKEEEDMKQIRKMIKRISYKNERLMSSYKEKYPDYNDPESKNSDKYSKFVIEAMGGAGDNNKEKEDKIIRNISKVTTVLNKKV